LIDPSPINPGAAAFGRVRDVVMGAVG
jgi:hypothetical protein